MSVTGHRLWSHRVIRPPMKKRETYIVNFIWWLHRMKVSWHVHDFCNSRWISNEEKHTYPCEYCSYRLDPWEQHWVIQEIHHGLDSYRWKRKHSKDWTDLIWVCKKCHDHIHAENNIETKAYILEAIQYRIRHKDKCRDQKRQKAKKRTYDKSRTKSCFL